MQLIVDDEHLGTSETVWRRCDQLTALPRLEVTAIPKVILVAPHPDDEVFGAGGLLQRVLSLGIPVEVLAVTDGERSHPHSKAVLPGELASRRSDESQEALRRLGWGEPVISRLRIPDGEVQTHRDVLRDALVAKLQRGDWCLAPWRFDGHPDHDACGAVALQACGAVGAVLFGYLVWAWHWAAPHTSDIPWSGCWQLPLSRNERARKRWATNAFVTQISSVGPSRSDAAVLPAPLLRRFWRPYEVYVGETGLST